MASVDRKTEIAPINGTPVKRMFWSIISDYGLLTGVCELVDNAIDLWNRGERKRPLTVLVDLNVQQQTITVRANARGVPRDFPDLLVTPGGSANDPEAEVIGLFGFGSKRAGVALGEYVEIKTRHSKGESFEINITKDWLADGGWEMPAYQIPDFEPNATQVVIAQLRKPISVDGVEAVRQHLAEVYKGFLGADCTIEVNGAPIAPLGFDTWAYPPGFEPVRVALSCDLGHPKPIQAKITAGLIRDRDAAEGNYGVYFYLNGRLVAKELKTRDVGYFVSTEAGVPHPDASLCRVIVELNGPARLMPWNSSKSQIDFGHEAYLCIRPSLIQLVSRFSKISRHLKNDREDGVFKYDDGAVQHIDPEEVTSAGRIVLPPLPKLNKSQIEKLKARNKTVLQTKPWTLGMVEAFGAVDAIGRQKLETGNRIALILLDSTFEIALKEFIVHEDSLFPPRTYDQTKLTQIFARRYLVLNEIKAKVSIPDEVFRLCEHYYGIRNKLVHERATVDVTTSDVANYRLVVSRVLKTLFGVQI